MRGARRRGPACPRRGRGGGGEGHRRAKSMDARRAAAIRAGIARRNADCFEVHDARPPTRRNSAPLARQKAGRG